MLFRRKKPAPPVYDVTLRYPDGEVDTCPWDKPLETVLACARGYARAGCVVYVRHGSKLLFFAGDVYS